jgi:hypothetical protein
VPLDIFSIHIREEKRREEKKRKEKKHHGIA